MISRKIIRPIDTGFKEYYRILLDDEHVPCELDKEHVDFVLSDFLNHFKEIQKGIERLYDYDYELYRLLFKDTYNTLDVSDGRSWKLSDIISIIEDLQESLETNDDEIKSAEESIILNDLGFRREYWDERIWTKILEDTDEKEVVEEVILLKGSEPLHRKRTTIWEKVPGGKSSKSIVYEDLPISEELRKAAENDNKEKR